MAFAYIYRHVSNLLGTLSSTYWEIFPCPTFKISQFSSIPVVSSVTSTRAPSTRLWNKCCRISLGMRPANEMRRYVLTTSLIGWAHSRIPRLIPGLSVSCFSLIRHMWLLFPADCFSPRKQVWVWWRPIQFIAFRKLIKTSIADIGLNHWARSMSWLLTRLLASPGHQQPWYGSLSCTRQDFNCLHHFNVKKWNANTEMQMYIYFLVCQTKSVSKELNVAQRYHYMLVIFDKIRTMFSQQSTLSVDT